MPEPDGDAPGTARLIVRYGPGGGSLISANLIGGRPPTSRFKPEPGDHGVWLIVRNHDGLLVQALPLPDPRNGQEAIDPDGMFRRGVAGEERVQAVEVAYPGKGASFEVHVGGRRDGGRQTRGDGRGDTIVLRGALELAPLRRAFNPDLIEHPGPGEANADARTLLFLPDGFTLDEMPLFRDAIDGVMAGLLATEPFRSQPRAVRIAHVELPSNESGIGRDPRDTAFRSRFAIDRVIEADQSRAARALEKYCSGRSAAALICANTTEYGGSGGAATVFSRHPDWLGEIAIHELGHGWFGLADEYTFAGQAATMQPVEPNVSGTAERALIKWKKQISAATPLPTLADEPEGVIGAFEGAKYYTTGIFRPAIDCKMRTPGKPFCPVCVDVLKTELDRHL